MPSSPNAIHIGGHQPSPESHPPRTHSAGSVRAWGGRDCTHLRKGRAPIRRCEEGGTLALRVNPLLPRGRGWFRRRRAPHLRYLGAHTKNGASNQEIREFAEGIRGTYRRDGGDCADGECRGNGGGGGSICSIRTASVDSKFVSSAANPDHQHQRWWGCYRCLDNQYHHCPPSRVAPYKLYKKNHRRCLSFDSPPMLPSLPMKKGEMPHGTSWGTGECEYDTALRVTQAARRLTAKLDATPPVKVPRPPPYDCPVKTSRPQSCRRRGNGVCGVSGRGGGGVPALAVSSSHVCRRLH